MGKIVAMGGGELRDEETLAMDKRVVELTGQPRPKALFIPTASGDPEGYCDTFERIYGRKLGCRTENLLLIREKLTAAAAAEKISDAHLIYVGGGNTLRMMTIWRRLGVDILLKAAFERGTVLAGLSAGAICWFAYGHSDSRSFTSPNNWTHIRVRGLGLVDAIYCPHLDSENRADDFKAMVGKYALVGIGVEDHCALEVLDGAFRVITSRSGKNAYKVTRRRGGQVDMAPIAQTAHQPLDRLLTR